MSVLGAESATGMSSGGGAEAGGGGPPERDPRVYLAGERTMLAWVRTGVTMMGFGFVVARFSFFLRELADVRGDAIHRPVVSMWLGTAIVLLGVAVNVIGSVRHMRFTRRLRRGETDLMPPRALELLVPGVLAVIGLGMAAYLALLGW